MPPKEKNIIEPINADFDDVASAMVISKTPVPVATHRTSFKEVFGVDVDYYVLKDKRRLISKKGMAAAIGQKSPRGNTFLRVMESQNLSKYLGAALQEKINNPIVFQPSEGGAALHSHGYDATILIDVCTAILAADRAGALQPTQRGMVMQAQIILGATAKGGIISLGDKLAGYDATRKEYIELYKQFIREEAKKYEPEFSEEFYDVFYRLYGYDKDKYKNENDKYKFHPKFFAQLTRKYVYQPLANSKGAILENLDEKNPIIYKGGRKYKLFQFLEDVGVKALRNHLGQVIGIGKLSTDKENFKRNFEKVFGKEPEFDFDE